MEEDKIRHHLSVNVSKELSEIIFWVLWCHNVTMIVQQETIYWLEMEQQ